MNKRELEIHYEAIKALIKAHLTPVIFRKTSQNATFIQAAAREPNPF